MAWLASPCLACHARLRHEGSNPASGEQHDAQKKKRGIKARPALDPLVSSGNPAHRYSSCAKTHRARPRHRMVHLATRTSGRSPQSPHKTESATVVLMLISSLCSVAATVNATVKWLYLSMACFVPRPGRAIRRGGQPLMAPSIFEAWPFLKPGVRTGFCPAMNADRASATHRHEYPKLLARRLAQSSARRRLARGALRHVTFALPRT